MKPSVTRVLETRKGAHRSAVSMAITLFLSVWMMLSCGCGKSDAWPNPPSTKTRGIFGWWWDANIPAMQVTDECHNEPATPPLEGIFDARCQVTPITMTEVIEVASYRFNNVGRIDADTCRMGTSNRSDFIYCLQRGKHTRCVNNWQVMMFVKCGGWVFTIEPAGNDGDISVSRRQWPPTRATYPTP